MDTPWVRSLVGLDGLAAGMVGMKYVRGKSEGRKGTSVVEGSAFEGWALGYFRSCAVVTW